MDTQTTATVTDTPINEAKPTRLAAALAFLQKTPKWALITVPVAAVALGSYGYMHKNGQSPTASNIAAVHAPAMVAGPYAANSVVQQQAPAAGGATGQNVPVAYGPGYAPVAYGPYDGPANYHGYGNGYGRGDGYGNGYGNGYSHGRGHGNGHMNTSFSFGGNMSGGGNGYGNGYGNGDGSGHGNGRNGAYYW